MGNRGLIYPALFSFRLESILSCLSSLHCDFGTDRGAEARFSSVVRGWVVHPPAVMFLAGGT
jgi:hypothetical protein